ncbi:hypothetical protein [Proteiniborus sp. MB09-C3]|uniref:hypothetical protein n=1 Tax=Proteiniborus sp. MB09-C3 TaxID=3050072 RepID=UPI002555F645|nr:hypothetical protein [Proteiniborus sp. MB09-C3]WIV12664.1 hypothetical protein QO263_02825 [Proteiniborus sp. MB09-C3]
MKKVKLMYIMILIALVMVGCDASPKESTDRISSPNNSQIPISGTWKIAKVIEENSNDEDSRKIEWENKTLEFSEEYVTLGDYYLKEPRYQVKRVNGREYLLYNHKTFLEDFNIPDGEVEVITVIDKDKYFCDIVRISENELILSVSNYNFNLIKISDKVENNSGNQNMQKTEGNNFTVYENDSLIRSGILLGLRSNNSNEYTYRTVWIGFKNKRLDPILETEGIIFPRRSGFWKMEIIKNTEAGKTEDFLFAHNISKENANEAKILQFDYSDWTEKVGNIQKRIDYIGNDYVSIEVLGNGSYEQSDKIWQENILQTLPIDSLASKKNIKITDLSGDESIGAIELGIQKTMENLKIKKSNLINKYKLLNSFGLERKMGHWFFKGRINYMLDDEFYYEDYNINIIPPSKLVMYDDLNISWTHIKNKVPGAIDAFTSPYKDVVLVLTKSEIIIYGIEKGEIESSPLRRIGLKDNEAVIMAEWATGDYVDNWSKTLMGLNDSE